MKTYTAGGNMADIWRDLQRKNQLTWHMWIAVVIGTLWTGLALVGIAAGRNAEALEYLFGGLGVLCGTAAEFLPEARGRERALGRLMAMLLIVIFLAIQVARRLL